MIGFKQVPPKADMPVGAADPLGRDREKLDAEIPPYQDTGGNKGDEPGIKGDHQCACGQP